MPDKGPASAPPSQGDATTAPPGHPTARVRRAIRPRGCGGEEDKRGWRGGDRFCGGTARPPIGGRCGAWCGWRAGLGAGKRITAPTPPPSWPDLIRPPSRRCLAPPRSCEPARDNLYRRCSDTVGWVAGSSPAMTEREERGTTGCSRGDVAGGLEVPPTRSPPPHRTLALSRFLFRRHAGLDPATQPAVTRAGPRGTISARRRSDSVALVAGSSPTMTLRGGRGIEGAPAPGRASGDVLPAADFSAKGRGKPTPLPRPRIPNERSPQGGGKRVHDGVGPRRSLRAGESTGRWAGSIASCLHRCGAGLWHRGRPARTGTGRRRPSASCSNGGCWRRRG